MDLKKAILMMKLLKVVARFIKFQLKETVILEKYKLLKKIFENEKYDIVHSHAEAMNSYILKNCKKSQELNIEFHIHIIQSI